MIIVRPDLAQYIKESHSVVFSVNIMKYPVLHTEGHPFCSDPTCPCREDQDNINLLNDLIKQGLLTTEEANQVMQGATI